MTESQIQNKTNLIRQVIFEVQKDKYYKFDVDETTSFYELKKILCNAAHLRRGSFRIYKNEKDYTYDYDDNTLLNLFPNEQTILFTLIKVENFPEEEEYIIKLDANSPCSIHDGKYLIFYCYNCKQSICKNCFDENHKNHYVKEKYDYLAPTQILINNIFSDSKQFYADENYDKTFMAFELKERLNKVLFVQLKNMIDQIALKLNDVIDYFNNCVVETRENTNENISRLKDFSIDAFKALKNDISTNKIMINDDIFLTLDEKIKEIDQSKSFLRDNVSKYIAINNNFETIKNLVNQIYSDLFNNISKQLTINIYDEIKNNIRTSLVMPISKDKIMERMFSNVKVARKSLGQKDPDTPININNENISLLENQKNQNIQINKATTQSPSKTITFNKNYYSPNSKYNINNKININQDNSFSTIENSLFNYPQTQPNFLDNFHQAILNSGSKKKQLIIDENEELKNESNTQLTDKRNSKVKGDVFIYPIELTSNIMIENSEGCESLKVDFPVISNLNVFLEKCAFCNHQNKLYISGGIDKNGLFSNSFLKYEKNSKIIIIQSNLLKSRANHSMIGYNKNIYVIGGIGTNKCEKFNELKWESMSDLLEKEVQLPMLYIYKDYLYAFGGLNKNGILNSIERINLKNNRAKWEFVSYLNHENIDNKVYGCGLIETNNELLFIGGKKDNDILKSTFKYDLINNTFYNCNFSFEFEVYFKENPFREIGENIYANINENGKSPLVFNLPSSI